GEGPDGGTPGSHRGGRGLDRAGPAMRVALERADRRTGVTGDAQGHASPRHARLERLRGSGTPEVGERVAYELLQAGVRRKRATEPSGIERIERPRELLSSSGEDACARGGGEANCVGVLRRALVVEEID